ncbi:hypothetical protein FJZ36_16065 [Candidatus Poribacteria bacterium]|nr:hypothetical protein [Candidatus Poribacteria bacterium]
MEPNDRHAAGRFGVTWRVVVVGLPLVALLCGIVSYAELVITYVQIGFLQFPPAVVALFFFLVAANRPAARWTPHLALSRSELAVVYCMLLLAAMVTSRGLMEKLIPALVAVNYFANDTNAWAHLFFRNLRPELVPFSVNGPANQDIAKLFYEKVADPSQIPWDAWLVPLAAWGVLAFCVFFGFFCLAAILRRQWVDNEKLSFPLTQLPVEFVREDARAEFFGNPLMWLGFGLPTVVFCLNGIHQHLPTVPEIGLSYNLHTWLREKPWNGIFYTPLFVSFAATGFFYLLPTQVLFSLWVFFALTRVEDIVATALGFRIGTMPLYPTRLYIGYQVAGAYVVLTAYFIYSGLPHFWRVARRFAARIPRGEEESGELISYRAAVWGLAASFAATVAWCVWAGISPLLALFQFGFYIAFTALVMARSVAEAGMPMTETSFRPTDLYAMFGQKAALGARNLTTLSLVDAIFARDLRGLPLTGFLDSLKISDGAGFRRRSLLVVAPLAMAFAFVIAAGLHLWLPYTRGANFLYGYVYSANPIWAFQDYAPAVEGLRPPISWVPAFFFCVGAVVAVFLAAMRTLYWWWPLHPLGYALSASWTLIVFWFPILLVWAFKTPLLRFSGVRGYRRFRPFFLGMVFGEFSMAVLWTGISWLTKVPAPVFPWP